MYTNKKTMNKNKIMVAHEKMLKMIPNMIEEHKKRTESLQFRHNLLQTQKRNNYINEYERLNGYLYSHITPPLQAEIQKDIKTWNNNLVNQVHKSFISTPNYSLYEKHAYNKMMNKK